MLFLAALALAASLVSAIQFTSPAANATLTKAEDYELTWSSVDTDPDKFSVYLVNFVNWPPFYTLLAEDIETASGAHTVRVPCGVDSSDGFQFNAINGTNVYVIYAQTPKFSISGGPCTDPVATSACAIAPASTVTVTVSKTLSSPSQNSTAKPTTTIPATIPASLTNLKRNITLGAKCPDTIGWGESGYNYPVTLTSVPHPPGDSLTTSAPITAGAPKPTDESTTKVYLTVYKDLSEASGSCSC